MARAAYVLAAGIELLVDRGFRRTSLGDLALPAIGLSTKGGEVRLTTGAAFGTIVRVMKAESVAPRLSVIEAVIVWTPR